MTDLERITTVLKEKAFSPEKAEGLVRLLEEFVAAYDKGASKAVAELLQRKVVPLNSSFNSALGNLQQKMGL